MPAASGPNAIVLDAFRHNAWATRRLIELCRPLDSQQRAATAAGCYGDIPSTLDHIIRADGSYARRMAQLADISGAELTWAEHEPSTDLDELDVWAQECAELWERILARPIDTEQQIAVDDGARTCRIGIFFAQALNHANHHRAQVSTVLTVLGLEAPDIQAWEYAWDSGRIWDNH